MRGTGQVAVTRRRKGGERSHVTRKGLRRGRGGVAGRLTSDGDGGADEVGVGREREHGRAAVLEALAVRDGPAAVAQPALQEHRLQLQQQPHGDGHCHHGYTTGTPRGAHSQESREGWSLPNQAPCRYSSSICGSSRTGMVTATRGQGGTRAERSGGRRPPPPKGAPLATTRGTQETKRASKRTTNRATRDGHTGGTAPTLIVVLAGAQNGVPSHSLVGQQHRKEEKGRRALQCTHQSCGA